MGNAVRITAVQEPPVYYDREATLQRGAEIIARAAADGSQLVIFPEAWVSGFLEALYSTAWSVGTGLFDDIYRLVWDSAVDLDRGQLAPICDAAKEHGVVVVIGIHERPRDMSGGTLYNTGVTIDADGKILNRHRKLMPTSAERQVWGFGDGSSLRVVDTAVGRVGVLMCWEAYMPLARMSLYAQNMDIFCNPTGDSTDNTRAAMQFVAREGGCATVSACAILREEDVPEDFPDRSAFREPDNGFLWSGCSVIAEPSGWGKVAHTRQQVGLFTEDVDLDLIKTARRNFDVAGHYARPDVFHLEVNTAEQRPVSWTDAPTFRPSD
jgi:nitrilase